MFYLCRTIYSPLNMPWSLTYHSFVHLLEHKIQESRDLCLTHNRCQINIGYGTHDVCSACNALPPPPTSPSWFGSCIPSSGESSWPPPILGRDKYAPIAALSTLLSKNRSPCIKTLILEDESPTSMSWDRAGSQYKLNEWMNKQMNK